MTRAITVLVSSLLFALVGVLIAGLFAKYQGRNGWEFVLLPLGGIGIGFGVSALAVKRHAMVGAITILAMTFLFALVGVLIGWLYAKAGGSPSIADLRWAFVFGPLAGSALGFGASELVIKMFAVSPPS